jgi:hypothetical protein
MIEIQFGKNNKLKMYRAADELPMKLYSRFQKYLLVENGVGSTIEAIGTHFAKWFELQSHELHKEALEEGKNLYYNFYMVLQEMNVPGLAFCCLVHSVDDIEVVDYSENNLKALTDALSSLGLTQKVVEQAIDEVKKKSILN